MINNLRAQFISALLIIGSSLPTQAAGDGYGDSYGGYGNSSKPFNWSGWYIGANAGWGWRSKNSYPDPSYYTGLGVVGLSTYGGADTQHDGFSAGGTLGYGYRFGSFVLGTEYDLQYADVSHDPVRSTAYFGLPTNATITGYDVYGIPIYGGGTSSAYSALNFDATDGDSNQWYGIVRVRAGVVATEKLLLFGMVGAAYRFSYDYSDPYVVAPNGVITYYRGYNDSNAWGFVYGGGAEYAVSDRVSAKVEYLRMDFGEASYLDPIATTATGRPVIYDYDRTVDIVRAGVNFKFSFGPGSSYGDDGATSAYETTPSSSSTAYSSSKPKPKKSSYTAPASKPKASEPTPASSESSGY